MSFSKLVIVLLLTTFFLVGCGGGGGGNDSASLTPTNRAPSLTLQNSNIDLIENSSTTVSVSFSDPDGDAVTINVSSSASLSVSYNNASQLLTISAAEVSTDSAGTVTVVASDQSGARTTRTISVNIIDQPNLAPVLTLESDSIELIESKSTSISVSFSDPDGDAVSITVTASELLTANYDDASQLLTITAGEVSSDSTGTVTVVATDARGLSVTKTVNVNIADNVAPELIFIDEESTGFRPIYSMSENTRFSFPIRVDDPDNTFEDFQYNVEFSIIGDFEETPIFDYSVDSENGIVEIVVGEAERDHFYDLSVTVSDGVSTDTKTAELRVRNNRLDLALRIDNLNFYIVDEESVTVNYKIYTSEPNLLEIQGVTYDNEIDQQENPLDISIDEANKTITFTGGNLTEDRFIPVRFMVAERFPEDNVRTVGQSIFIVYKANLSELESDYIAKLNEVSYLYEFAAEKITIINYLRDVFIIQNFYGVDNPTLSLEELRDLVDDSLIEVDRQRQFVFSVKGEINNQRGRIFDFFDPSTPLESRQTLLQEELLNLTGIGSFATDEFWFSNLTIDIDTLLNLTDLTTKFVGVESERMLELPNGKYSRYVGNSRYGQYVNGVWTFNEEYKYLVPPLTRYLEMDIR